jgi:hypothetical protein
MRGQPTSSLKPYGDLELDVLAEFLPTELTDKCYLLVRGYHDLYGYTCLPDMLWHSDARYAIEFDPKLSKIFRKASRTRRTKPANAALLRLATILVALEVLARDFGSWGLRFPAARQEAQRLLGERSLDHCAWLMDKYLYYSTSSIQRSRLLAPY